MKLLSSILPVFLVLGGVVSDQFERQDVSTLAAPQDLNTVLQVIRNVNSKSDRLASTIKNWGGQSNNANQILDDAKDLTNEFNHGANRILDSRSRITDQETNQLREPIFRLGGSMEQISIALAAKKDQMDSIGFSSALLHVLHELRGHVKKFDRAVVDRVADKQAANHLGMNAALVERVERGINALKARPAPNRPPPGGQEPYRGDPYQGNPPPG